MSVGPRGDGYKFEDTMTLEEARVYHSEQVAAVIGSPIDWVTATTMTNAKEATAIAHECRIRSLRVVVSFTVETNGRLPDGSTLQEAVEFVDDHTDCAPIYCAHPSHFADVLLENPEAPWVERIKGIRVNASRGSHSALNLLQKLDAGNYFELATECRDLYTRIPSLWVVGGCCGTDGRHISEICRVIKKKRRLVITRTVNL
eukprot:GHVN01033898.1.p1 GENE.GHVN01033898.1~~GHVN01033898.1.p1  ORF type:complete len:202 (-),score=25.61 GHVN01033898.1:91-696(-)